MNAEVRSGIVALYPKLVRAAAARFRLHIDDARELVHDTIAQALRCEDRFVPGSNLHAWLCAVMRNLKCSQLRRGKIVTFVSTEFTLSHETDSITFDLPVPGAQEHYVDLDQALTALAELPPEQQSAIVLIARGHSYDEAAAMTKVPVGTMKSRTARGRQALAAAVS